MPVIEAAAADRDDDRVGVGRVLLDLEPDRAGAGDARAGRRTGGRACARSPRCSSSSRANASAGSVGLEVDGRAVAARRGDLQLGGALPHHDERVDAVLRPRRRRPPARGSRPRSRSRRARSSSAVEARELVERAARLERAGALEELALQPGAERARGRAAACAARWRSTTGRARRTSSRSTTLPHRLEEEDRGGRGGVQAVGARRRRPGSRRARRRPRSQSPARPPSSAPTTIAVGARRGRHRCSSISRAGDGCDERDAEPGAPRRASASTIGSVKTAPVEARIAFGFQASARASATSSASAPAASARAGHRAEVARLLDSDRDEVEASRRAAARAAAPRRRRSRPPARPGRPSSRARARSPARPRSRQAAPARRRSRRSAARPTSPARPRAAPPRRRGRGGAAPAPAKRDDLPARGGCRPR